ncbi:MAG TPA: MFS transporter [Usitatibacter sp.]|nr:MFS transporter [Usitatibacter sp.]
MKNNASLAIPRGVWILGFVSLLMDISSEMIHGLLPVYLTAVLGASALAVGLIEGAAESTALIVKVFSGALSDRWHKRQAVAATGYGLAAFTKPLFALATGPGLVFFARFVDRIGKGIRGAPRDALIADLTPKEIRGAAFGLRQTLDTVGAFAGPLLAIALMLAWHDDFRAVFWVAVVPGIASFLLIAFGVREPRAPVGAPAAAKREVRFDRETLRTLGPAFWGVTAAGAALALARFSEAFLVLRASDLHLGEAYAPAVLVVMNVIYSLAAYPVGRMADRVAPRVLLFWGVAFLVAADAVLAVANHLAFAWIGIALWGLHMGFTQGVLAAMVAHSAPPQLRGTAFGVFNLAGGIAMLVSSALAGALWSWAGPAATFWAGAFFAVACAAITKLAVR